MSLLSTLQADEQWVIAEIRKGWQLLQKVEQTVAVDAVKVQNYLVAHHANIIAVFQGLLTTLTADAAFIPQLAPLVPIATAGIDAATAAIDAVSKHVLAGSTPMSTLENAYQTLKDAQKAVDNALAAATKKPVSVPAPVTLPASAPAKVTVTP